MQVPDDVHERSGPTFDRIAGNIVNSGVTGWLTSLTGDPDTAAIVGGIVGPLAEELSFASRKVTVSKLQKISRLLGRATSTTDRSPAAFLEDVTSNLQKTELLSRAIEAAARATTEEKIDWLANVLASGAIANDTAVVDEYILAVDALAELDTPHIRIMTTIAKQSPQWWSQADQRKRLRFSWPESRIADEAPGLASALSVLTARLVAVGVARDVSLLADTDESVWELTEFGRICLETLRNRSKTT